MRIDTIRLDEITFVYQTYPSTLKESLLRAGQNFPIYVRRNSERYICQDGAKRLSAIHDILQENKQNIKFQAIKVIIEDTARTSPPYHLHNHH